MGASYVLLEKLPGKPLDGSALIGRIVFGIKHPDQPIDQVL